MNNTPNSGGRKRTPISSSGSVRKTERISTNGPVGRKDGYAGRTFGGSSGGPVRSGGGLVLKLLPLILVIGLGALLLRLCTGGCTDMGALEGILDTPASNAVSEGSGTSFNVNALESLLGGFDATDAQAAQSLPASTSSASASTAVSNRARAKYTTLKGNGSDIVTVMVYLCGTDLESQNGMGTADLNEMLHARLDDEHVNVIVETGGAKTWNNSVISNRTNQRYRVTNQGLLPLDENLGRRSMVEPSTLSDFIRYCASSFPADRYALILWDHGGGSVSGYGYDQFYAGSMTLDEIGKALSDGGVKFDFIGFDACLMGTLETALVCEPYADYLIASEESEPGCGWYYTNWLTNLSQNSSLPTVKVAETIIDDFNNVCQKKYPGCHTTLSVVDLAEFAGTVPEPFAAFAKSVGALLDSNQYQTVSDARYNAREYGASSKANHVDLVDLASKVGTSEARELVTALLGCVKYNRTSTSRVNSYGLSIYFPYSSFKGMSTAVRLYDTIGMSEDYTECIKSFSSLAAGGQLAASGSPASSPSYGLFGQYGAQSYSSGSLLEYLIGSGAAPSGFGADPSSLLASILGGDGSGWFDSGRVLQNRDYYDAHALTASDLQFSEKNGRTVLSMPKEKWALVQDVRLNVFVDDGDGYLDLGLDAIYQFDRDGDLLIDWDGAWIGIEGHLVPYYLEDAVTDGGKTTYTGRVPALLNDELVNLYLVFVNDVPRVLGYQPMYTDETDTASKSYLPLRDGDELVFVSDHYTYDDVYEGTYKLADPLTVRGELTVEDMNVIADRCLFSFVLRDLYGNELWTAFTAR